MGTDDLRLRVRRGWKLTSLTDKSDNTEPMKTLISAAKELAVKAAAATTPLADGPPIPTFQLYKLVYDEAGVAVSLADHQLSPPSQQFEWPGVLGALSWLLGFGEDSY